MNVIEAMYKGVPVIAKDNRGHRELVKNSENGFIIKDKTELYNKIKIILRNKALKQTFKKAAREKAEKYDLKEVIKKMEKIYKGAERCV